MMTGFTSRLPAGDYFGLPALNISSLKQIAHSPKHYRYRLANPKASKFMRLGTAAHCAVLEPYRFATQFAIWGRRSEKTGNLCPRNGQLYEAFAAENVNREIITEDDRDAAMAIQAAVRADPEAMHYLESGDPEVTMEWEMDGRRCKGRADWITEVGDKRHLVGLKTTGDVRPFAFGSKCAKFGYHMQWAWYCDGYHALTGVRPVMREIVVESVPPFDVVVYRVPDDVIEQGRDDYRRLLAILDNSEKCDFWPGVSGGQEAEVTLPTWMYEQEDDISELDLEVSDDG